MSKNTNGYSPTEAESKAINRACLEAAHAALAPLRNDDLPPNAWTAACIQAFRAINKVEREWQEKLLAANPGASYISHYANDAVIACTALYCVDDKTVNDVSPSSVAGTRMAAMIAAAKALEAMGAIYEAFDDTEVFGTHFADEVAGLMEAHEAERLKAQS